MVSGPLSIDPFRTQGTSEIFDVDLDVAAEQPVAVASHMDDSPESEAEPAIGVEPGNGRQIRPNRFEADLAAI